LDSLKKQTFSGITWTAIDTFVLKGLSFLALITLARWLGPEEFGLIGMFSVFVTIGLTLVDSGLSHSIIRLQNADNSDYSTVFYANLSISIVVYVLLFFCAPYIAEFYRQPSLALIVRLYCLSFIINAFSAIQLAILTKNMEFKKIMFCNIPGVLLGIIIGVVMGYLGYGVWSVVIMNLSTQLIQSLVLWFSSGWKPTLTFSMEKLKYHFHFGYKLTLSGLLNTVFNNIYNVLIGRFYPLIYSGYYERAFSLNQYPVTTLSGILSKISYPLLSKIQHEKDRISEVYQRLLKVSFFITAPLMMGAAAVAEPLFTLVLGEKWLPAVPYFQILCLASIFYPVHSLNINVLKVFGRSDLFLKLEIVKKALTIICIIVAFPFGIYGLMWSSVAVSVIGLLINTYYSSDMIQYKTKKQMIDMLPIFLLSLSMFFVMYSVVELLDKYLLFLQLSLAAITGVAFYYLGTKLFKLNVLSDAMQLIKIKNYK
jgi:O-antigen/teichoic acid export membrane protein